MPNKRYRPLPAAVDKTTRPRVHPKGGHAEREGCIQREEWGEPQLPGGTSEPRAEPLVVWLERGPVLLRRVSNLYMQASPLK